MNTIESVRELYSDIKRIYDLHGKPENISLVETPGGHSYHRISREEIHSFFLEHLMGKDISPQEAVDIDTLEANRLSAEELKIYVDGIPEDDRTTTIQNSFVKLAKVPEINDEKALFSYRDSVKSFLKEKTFGAFPDVDVPFDARLEFRALDGGQFGWNIYSFVPEEGWRLKVDFHWRNDTIEKKPLMIILKNYDEERWGAESFAGEINTDWNIAYFEVRGVGETGWDPALNWHVRRAAAWTGRTIASMQVYDLLRCIEFCRTLPRVDPSQIAIAAKDEMTVVALYSALMDAGIRQVVLKNPAATQDVASSTNGKGEAIEMLNCLRVTDVNQLPALILPTETLFLNDMPASYEWSGQMVEKFSTFNTAINLKN